MKKIAFMMLFMMAAVQVVFACPLHDKGAAGHGESGASSGQDAE